MVKIKSSKNRVCLYYWFEFIVLFVIKGGLGKSRFVVCLGRSGKLDM